MIVMGVFGLAFLPALLAAPTAILIPHAMAPALALAAIFGA